MYKKLVYLLAIVTTITIALFINSCQDSSITPTVTEIPRNSAGNGCDSANVFCGSPGTIEIQNPCPGNVSTIDLWAGVGNAGAGALVGHVEFYFVSGNTWTVKYIFTDPLFEPTSIHFAISCTLAGIPQTKQHNPIPGQFPYKFNGPFGSSFQFNITLPSGCSCYYVAAHAGGNLGGLEGFTLGLPVGCVTASNMFHGFDYTLPFQGCYASFTLSNTGTGLDGTYCGWCIDCGTSLGEGTFNCACVYSSYDTILNPGLKAIIEGWQNFDKVNYLINHFHVGQVVQPLDDNCNPIGGPDTLTVMDIQATIWQLLDVGTCLGGLRPEWVALTNAGKRNAILCDVNANGEGFVPSCANGDQIVFIVDPDCQNQTAQPVMASLPCSAAGATAWADGKYGGNFAGPNWATYFKWCPTCP